MSSIREMRLRIRSVKNIGQVTRALQAVSASRARRAIQANEKTKPYAEKAWKVVVHLARQPGRNSLHPLLTERSEVENILVIMITSDRGLSGASNMNVLRKTIDYFDALNKNVQYVPIGRKGRDLLWRFRKNIYAEFSYLPSPPTFLDVSAIGRLVVNEFLKGSYDQVYLSYNNFVNMLWQEPIIRKLLPLEVVYTPKEEEENVDVASSYNVTHSNPSAVFTYEPDQDEILDQIIPRFVSMQVYQAILTAQASEHAARMVAMRNATDNAAELVEALQLEYNKVRQQSITNDVLDIASSSEAMAQESKYDFL